MWSPRDAIRDLTAPDAVPTGGACAPPRWQEAFGEERAVVLAGTHEFTTEWCDRIALIAHALDPSEETSDQRDDAALADSAPPAPSTG